MGDVFQDLSGERQQWPSIDMAGYRRIGSLLPGSVVHGDTSASVSQFSMADMVFSSSEDPLLDASPDGGYQQFPDSSVPNIFDFPTTCPQSSAYFLLAQTSPLTLLTEQPVSYLNQGHLYKIMFQSSSLYPSNLLKSVIRVTFQDRGLEALEQMRVCEWHQMHPNDRMVEIDKPQCDNVINLLQDPHELNVVSIMWNSLRPPTLEFQLNCVGSEFTSRKNGGQKGVVFKLVIVTSIMPRSHDVVPEIIHCASSLVKVFKSSGAERKVSLEREKLEVQSEDRKKLYRPSADCTKFTDIPVEVFLERRRQLQTLPFIFPSSLPHPSHDNSSYSQPLVTPPPLPGSQSKKLWPQSIPVPVNQVNHSGLLINPWSTCQEVVLWLQSNGFESFIPDLQKFSGADLLRLSREDLIRICKNTAEAIRLNNVLHLKKLRSRLRIYVHHEHSVVRLKGYSRSCDQLSSSSNSISSSSLSSRSSSNVSILNSESCFEVTELPWESGFDSSSMIGSGHTTTGKRQNQDDHYEADNCVTKRHCVAGQTCDDKIMIDHTKVYRAVHLDLLTVRHLVDQLSAVCKVSPENVDAVYVMNIHENLVYITDSDVEKLEDEASFTLHVQLDSAKVDRYIFLLETTGQQQQQQHLQHLTPPTVTFGF